MAQSILEKLSQRGFKKTRVREAIVSRLSALQKPIDALGILEFLAKSGLSVNKTTVYRELAFLLEQGAITEINFGDNKKRYEISGLPHHHHIICTACGRIQDVAAERDMAAFEKKIEKDTGFVIQSHNLEFFGLCPACCR